MSKLTTKVKGDKIVAILPTGAKIPLTGYEHGKKQGHALLNPETNGFSGFGVTADAAAKHLPTSITILGEVIQLTHDVTKGGNPRVKVQNHTTEDGRRVTVRIVDMGEGSWNYTIEVNPAAKKPQRKTHGKAIFA